MHRREFLTRASTVIGGLGVAGTFQNLLHRSAQGSTHCYGNGILTPAQDETTGLDLLQLPNGFRYQSVGWFKDPMSDGGLTPDVHDGMGVIHSNDKRLIICRNHEVDGNGVSFANSSITYDPKAGGGCTNLHFDRQRELFTSSRPALGGTVKNCAGGPTPWGSWLSCEETVASPGDLDGETLLEFEREHGYIFEVPAFGETTAEPLKDMGRFVHEAVAVDPETDIVYETEDRYEAGFYRFLPNRRRVLAQGGRLEMLKLVGRDDTSKGLRVGDKFDVTWVGIEDPDRAHSPGTADTQGVFKQGQQQGGATFARLEGCWYAGGKVFIVSTNGGDAGMGQVFEYVPRDETLKLVFESPAAEVLESPDNMTVSPTTGVLLLCEDGELKPQRLHGLTPDGHLFPFAANNVLLAGERNGFEGDFRDAEFAGATFSPDGKWLFVNIQNPGITFAITGPWADGPFA